MLLSAAALLASGATDQVIPTAPIIDFKLPVFNEQGYRAWELRGSEAIYFHEERRAEIKGLRLKVFSGDDRELVENEVESPFAVAVYRDGERTISGPGLLHMTGAERGREFDVRGEDWTYWEVVAAEGAKQKIKNLVIRKNVVVTFSEDIGNILK